MVTKTVSSSKHDWNSVFVANEPISCQCSKCKEIVICDADWCDSDGIVKWLNKIRRRKCSQGL